MSATRENDDALGGPEPPQDLDAERSVLAACLLNADGLTKARAVLTRGDFYRAAHQNIYAAILALADRGEAVDTITLAAELARRDDLAVVGGPAALASISDMATTTANTTEHARLVKDAVQRRRLRSLTLGVAEQTSDQTKSLKDILAHLGRECDALAAPDRAVGAGRFADATLTATDLCAMEIAKPKSLIGDGVLVAGGFAVLYGRPGYGKSWVALELARSLVRGEPWLGLPTPTEGVRVGILHLELGAYALQSRLRTLGIGQHERDRNLHVVCRPHLRGVVDLYERPDDMAALRQWVERKRLGMLEIDALSRAHTANENAADELGRVLAALDAMRHETGCALMLVHHEPKQGDRDPDNDLDALRGTGRLQSDPTLLVRVRQSRGLRFLRFAKVSEGPTPADVFFRLGEDGQPVVVESPESVATGNRQKVLRAVLEAGRAVTRAEVQEMVGLGRSTVADHLKALADGGRIGSTGEGKSLNYTVPTIRPSGASEHNGADGELPLSVKDLEGFPS